MRIGLDLDGCIVDSILAWIDLMNRGAGTHFTYDELPETYGTPVLGAFCDAHEIEMLILPHPMPGATEAMTRLKEAGHALIAITARHSRMQPLTEGWLQYYGIHLDGMHFLEGGSKVSTARAEAVDLMVEDAPKNALALAEGGVPVLLFGAPYNRNVSHPLISRCEGWSEVLSHIERLTAVSA